MTTMLSPTWMMGARLGQRAAVRLQPRPRAQAVLRPRRFLGPPFLHLRPHGWGLLRLQGPRRRVRHHRPPGCLTGRDGQGCRRTGRAHPARLPARSWVRREHLRHGPGYDVGPVYEACEARGIRPVVPLKETPFVKAGKHLPPTWEHGTLIFAGSDAKRGASKYRCPSGECSPARVWIKANRLHTLIPRESARWKKLYRGRSGVEREFGAPEARMGDAAPSGGEDRAGAAPRRPDDLVPAGRGTC